MKMYCKVKGLSEYGEKNNTVCTEHNLDDDDVREILSIIVLNM